MALFDSDFMKKLEYLSLLSRRVFRGHILAQRRTRQLGSGVEFADHREYAPGDDFRYIDWNVYARHGELLLKRFQEEEDLHVYLFVDCSKSMAQGDPSKFDYARQLAAALAYIALANLDRVSILGYADDVVSILPLTRGKEQILGVLEFLENLTPQGEDTDLRNTASQFLHRSQRRGLTVVISDFYDPKGYQSGIDALRYHRHEPTLLQVYDRTEAEPSLLGDLELEDVESGVLTKVTVTERNLVRYRELFQQFQSGMRTYCAGAGMSCTQASTEIPFDDLIVRMMRLSGAVR